MARKRWLIPVYIIVGIVALGIAGLGILAVQGYGITVGRCLIAGNGAYMLIDDNSPIVMSDRSGGDLFAKLETGDEILVLHDGINESYPGQTGAYGCIRLGGGGADDIPQNVIDSLTELGWMNSAEAEIQTEPTESGHLHALAQQPQTVEDPVSGYCGNTVTTVYADGAGYSFMYDDSVALTDILINLRYDEEKLCRCYGEYTVDTEFGKSYVLSIEQGFARCDAGQAELTAEQLESVKEILERQLP